MREYFNSPTDFDCSHASGFGRERHQVRAVFVRCCELLAPHFVANDHAKTVSTFAMGHMLIEHFPQLSSAEVQIVIMTVERLNQDRRLQSVLMQS